MMSTVMRACYLLVAALSVVAMAVTGYAYLTLDEFREGVNTTPALDDIPNPPPPDDGAEDILLVGTDSRTDAKGNPLPPAMLKMLRTEAKAGVNTDTLIVLRLPRDDGPPRAVSLPRDSWVDLPGGGQGKINSAFNAAKVAEAERLVDKGRQSRAQIELASDEKGRQALVQTVQDFTKVRVDHYAEVSLLGFYLLTEALGGVEVCLAAATSDADSGANFAAGRQTISGGEALSYVRQRKNLPRGDLDRIVRQQTFLGSALHKVLSADTLANRGKLDKLVDAVERSVVLDPDLDILEFARKARGLASGDVKFVTIPVETINGTSPDGKQSIVQVDPGKVRKFVRSLVRHEPNGSGGGSAPGAASAARQDDGEPITGGRAPCVN
ncbi:MAG: LCP family protein [Thermocrispum sp.]